MHITYLFSFTPDSKELGSNKNKKEREGLSQRKKATPRPFQISTSEFELDCPVLGGSSSDDFSLLSKSTTDPSALTFPSSSSKISSASSSTYRNSKVETALAKSKLATLSSDGPIEPTPKLGKRQRKAAKRLAKSLTKGPSWFNMSKVEITKDKKNDLEALKMRSATNGVLHYKRNHMTHTPKYFHTGTVVETAADFYSSRIPKKQRKSTLAKQFAADFGMEC